MTLGFKQYFPWHTEKNPAPTYFREKILAGVGLYVSPKDADLNYYSNQEASKRSTKKIHTMREDPHNRWKAGRNIQMVYRGAGYKILDHFNKGIPELETCKGKQYVQLRWAAKSEYVETTLPLQKIIAPASAMPDKKKRECFYYPRVWIDSAEVLESVIRELAINDGFGSVDDFFRWFNKDWSGYILHWTDFRY